MSQSKHPLYPIFNEMHQRCYNKNHPKYHRYGGRGILVCERWHYFENFLEDVGKRPDGMTLDRKDNNGHYNPNNCKWSTQKEQANNRQNSYIADNIKAGIRHCRNSGSSFQQVANLYGISKHRVMRICKEGE